MLEALANGAREIGLTNVETRLMDAERLDLSNESFDVVICRDGLMLFPDPAKALGEMCRVTRRGGRVAALVFSEEQRNPYFSIPQGIARRIGGLPEPPPGMPGPCSLGDPQRLADLFRTAGLHDVEGHRAQTVQRFPSATKALSSIQETSVHTRELMLHLTEAQREQAWQEVERALRRLEGPNGCELPGESLIIVGVK
jgi:SAM-dependent methyltransferase